ncbi:hypothetical protein BSZ35_12490 [Salinibacter sp. 10B]|uniref:hypothetical protein n=1 Tax=Salinibacter sp. 10B TaxID=1923971 RepID=UPI000CF4E5B2|nr:hypothetical protein [Salinibacter sp. 10B]PQJ35310.1 hypothetical protein BSZ35_12490 [Salinibacter sp. 10B]
MYNLHSPKLFRTRHGAILRCECCSRIQIEFREHVLLVDEDEFELLMRTVRQALAQLREAEEQESWQLQAQTDGGAVGVVLTEMSLAALHELLQGAWAMYVLEERIDAATTDLADRATDVVRDHLPCAG